MENKFYKNESKHKLKTFVIGFPRIGEKRELKVATEKYFRSQITENELRDIAKELRRKQWLIERENGVDFITAGDFSFYDNMLDTAALLNCLPERYNRLDLTTSLKKYFAAARGYQGERGDVKALAMKKWFNTNYHYIVPEIDDDTRISVAGTKIFEEYAEAKAAGIETVPALIGGFTFLKLAKFTGTKTPSDFIEYTAAAYIEIVKRLIAQGAKSIRFDEPYLVTDITSDDIGLFEELYERILSVKGKCQIYLQTYFGDIRDCYERVTALDFDGIGLDFVEGDSLALLQKYGFPKTKTLFAGIISGKNIWRTRYKDVLALIGEINKYSNDIVIGASCSLLHVPYTVKNEPKLGDARTKYLAFAIEKLAELNELGTLYAEGDTASDYKKNEELFSAPRYKPNAAVAAEVAALKPADFVRLPEFSERRRIQKAVLGLPLLP
ncbi:MAG: 5-methyltetrahydropteroyltriglutamate--homocysteine S-methyltransferase, partial [Clostridiales bacterium]|nr:5-methyltetrahydropteroyltriglutamate--homocysteine S-methyltransferase [Clostridiales bacterium]